MKLIFDTPIYRIEDKTIACILNCTLLMNEKCYDGIIPPKSTFCICQQTTCKLEDKFDIVKGCKIVLTKAEIKAYKRANDIIKYKYNLIKKTNNELTEFVTNIKKYKEHNDSYLKELTK